MAPPSKQSAADDALLTASGRDAGPPEHVAHGLDQLFAPYAGAGAPGLVVGISQHCRTVFRKGFGLASVQHGLANQPATRMRIGSTSKHFTALAALLLAEDGRLDLDVAVDRYFPALPALQGMPTLRQFLNHTSGYRCTLELGSFANGTAEQPADWQIKALHRQTGANFSPGAAQMYCNGTYHAVSLLIEQLAGMPLATFLADRIFTPLGMHATSLIVSDKTMVPGLASLHIPAAPGGWQRAPTDSELLGDGGIVSTVDDMLLWLAHLRGPKRVGSPETWRQMFEPAQLQDGHVSTYSLGLKTESYRGADVIHHSGAIWGGNCQMLTMPAHALDIIIMVNSGAPRATDLAWRVVDLLVGEMLPGTARRTAQADEFRHLLGARYQVGSGAIVTFGEVGEGLGMSLANMKSLVPIRDEGDGLRIGFEEYGQGPFRWNRRHLVAERGGPPRQLRTMIGNTATMLDLVPSLQTDDPSMLDGLVGRYRSVDLAAEAEIHAGQMPILSLRGDYGGTRNFRLDAYAASLLLLIDGLDPLETYQMTLDTAEGPISGFWLETFRARRLRFDRV